jgi:hypothetical protein
LIQNRDKSGQWYEFNDSDVSDFDPEDIPKEAFGGEATFRGIRMFKR